MFLCQTNQSDLQLYSNFSQIYTGTVFRNNDKTFQFNYEESKNEVNMLNIFSIKYVHMLNTIPLINLIFTFLKSFSASVR